MNLSQELSAEERLERRMLAVEADVTFLVNAVRELIRFHLGVERLKELDAEREARAAGDDV